MEEKVLILDSSETLFAQNFFQFFFLADNLEDINFMLQ